jgi:urea transport system permease protein
LLIIVLPLLDAAGIISHFTLNLWGKYLCYALLAISVDLLWGYTGLLSLGQALFFALGGYMHGMYLMRMIGDLGQHKKPIPDFLVFLGWTELPSFWVPFANFPFALTMAFLVPGLIAYLFGHLAFRSRIKGVYFSILTQALTYGASLMFFRNNLLMGGNNGFTDFKFILGFDLKSAATQRGLFIATAVALLIVYLFCRWLSRTKFGLVQQAIRDGENRVLFSGYATAHYKLFVFVVAALIAALGGILYVPQVGIINPSEMTPDKSLEAVVWVRRRRPRHDHRAHPRRDQHQRVEELRHSCVSRPLAHRAGRAFHSRRALPPRRPREHPRQDPRLVSPRRDQAHPAPTLTRHAASPAQR